MRLGVRNWKTTVPTKAGPSGAGDKEPVRTVSAVFRKPFSEQLAFFRSKLKRLVPTARWDDIRREAHDSAFMVAGAMKADLLSDLAAAVDRAIGEGQTLETFRRDFRGIVEKRGWHGWTGEGTKAGEAWRTRTIYRTNAATSYAAGRVAQLEESDFALWVYRHGGSQEPRLEHLALDGLTLPPDDPVWQTISPPNGWGCSCYIVGARSEKGAQRVGGDPEKPLPPDWRKAPGKGWDYPPGASASQTVQVMADKVKGWDTGLAGAFLDDLPTGLADRIRKAGQ
jgi:uncharacterized protein with gpF-like domain